MSLPTDASKLAVNGDRLWSSLMELARIGATPKGGVCRLALTDLDRQGRDLVVSWAKKAGMRQGPEPEINAHSYNFQVY